MTLEQIEIVNKKCEELGVSWDQGIFKEGQSIPTAIKEHCIYLRWLSGGVSGGSCWDEGSSFTNEDGEEEYNDPHYEIGDSEAPYWHALELAVKVLRPDLVSEDSKLQGVLLDEITSLTDYNTDTDYEYYGNYSEYTVHFIKVSDLEALLKTIA